MNNFSAYANLAKDKLIENSPKILLGIGILSGLAAVGYSIEVALTGKTEPILEDHKKRIEEVKARIEEPTDDELYISMTAKEYKKELAINYLKTTGYLAKLFGPAIALETVSIAATCGGFGILDSRYATAVAAFASTYTEFAEYRNRVAEKYGEEAEYDIYNNIVEETVESEVEDENGKKKKHKEKIKTAKNTKPGTFEFFLGQDYVDFWDDRRSDEQNNAEIKIRLAGAISNTNRDVKNNGYVYLSDFTKRCGLKPIEAHRHLALKYDPNWGDSQFSTDRNIKIKDAHILDGGEKVLLVEISGFEPFNVDEFDFAEFLRSKKAN